MTLLSFYFSNFFQFFQNLSNINAVGGRGPGRGPGRGRGPGSGSGVLVGVLVGVGGRGPGRGPVGVGVLGPVDEYKMFHKPIKGDWKTRAEEHERGQNMNKAPNANF